MAQRRKERRKEIFGKSQSHILTHYVAPLTNRNGIFEKFRRNQIHVLFIGRTKIGQTTLKNLLVDPATLNFDELISEFPSFEQFCVTGMNLILNFIDTPELFQNRLINSSLPDNKTLIHLIDSFV